MEQRASELPLLEEVTELIEREKTLMNLKLLEQHKQAAIWKEKYDKLVEKVVKDKSAPDGLDLHTLEIVAENVFSTKSPSKSGNVDKDSILHSLVSSNQINFSGCKIEESSIGEILKLMNTRLSGKTFQTANFSNCLLSDKHRDGLEHLLSSPRILAYDFSGNNLGGGFLHSACDALKTRRSSPQYLLVHDNVPLGMLRRSEANSSQKDSNESRTAFNSFFDCINDYMWGISVSFRDIDVSYLSENLDTVMFDENGNVKKDGADRLYGSSNTNTSLTYEFLKNLNASIEGSITAKRAGSKADSKKKPSASLSNKQSKAASHTVAYRGISTLHVLGLKSSQISKQSLRQLEKTLSLTMDTLVDLDMSNSFFGYNGYQILSSHLKSPGCELIRLGLASCSLGDYGIQLLCQSLQTNSTLTYLDARSNDITDSGLAMITALLGHNQVINKIDLSGNMQISLAKKVECHSLLRKIGSQATVIFDTNEKSTLFTNETLSNNWLLRLPTKILRYIPSVIREVRLYTVDIRMIQFQLPEIQSFGQSLAPMEIAEQRSVRFRWSWRPSTATASNYTGKEPLATVDISKTILQLELRITDYSTLNTSIIDAGTVPIASCLASTSDTNGEQFPWINSHCDLVELPEKGKVEILIRVRGLPSQPDSETQGENVQQRMKLTSQSRSSGKFQNQHINRFLRQISSFESVNCEVIPLALTATSGDDSHQYRQIACDPMLPLNHGYPEALLSHANMNSTVIMSTLVNSIPKKHKVMRNAHWLSHMTSGFISFEARLHAVQTEAKAKTNADDSGEAVDEALLVWGYEYAITIVADHRGVSPRSVTTGICAPINSNGHSRQEDTGIEETTNILKSWHWNAISVPIHGLQMNDMIVISARPIRINKQLSGQGIETDTPEPYPCIVQIANASTFESFVPGKMSASLRQDNYRNFELAPMLGNVMINNPNMYTNF